MSPFTRYRLNLPALLAVSLLGAAASGCAPVVVAGAAGAGAGAVAYQERSFEDAVDDAQIRLEINHYWFQESEDLYREVQLQVQDGRVLLSGIVPDPETRVNAVRLAWKAEGVREVINEIQVTDQSGVVDYARDTWISTQLKAKLLVDRDVLSINYSVETVNGTVYLIGIAQSEAELELVTAHARTIEDVKRVVSHVVLKDDSRRPATP